MCSQNIQKTPVQAMKGFLETNQENICKGLEKGMDKEKFMQSMYSVLLANPKVAQCSKMSVLNAVNNCAQLGLSANPQSGEAYLIPRDKKQKNAQGQWVSVGSECNFEIGYKGLIKIGFNSGLIKLMQVYAVHEGDSLVMQAGERPDYTIPRSSSTRGDLEGFLVMALLDSGHWDFGNQCLFVGMIVQSNQSRPHGIHSNIWSQLYSQTTRRSHQCGFTHTIRNVIGPWSNVARIVYHIHHRTQSILQQWQ